jgi:NAD+ synthase (glutamine-hydrolysing)
MRPYKIGCGTVNQTPLDWQGNIRRIKEVIRQAKKEQIDILCLPELCVTGYGCEDLFLSDWLPRKALHFLPELVAETEGLLTTINLPIPFKEKTYNCAILVENKQIKMIYAKQFMALDGVHYEPRWFEPWPIDVVDEIEINGSLYPIGDLTYHHNEWTMGFEICEDAWRGNDRPACRESKNTVNLILNPSASHFAMLKTHERHKLVIDSSRDYHCTYVYANLLGNEAGRMIYDGEMMIAQNGELALRNELLSFKEYQLKSIRLSPDEIIEKDVAPIETKEIEFPKATALALYDYLRKSRARGYTLSLSGGADSATCAVMVAEMVKRGIRELGKKEFIERINIEDISDKSEKEIVGYLFKTAYQSTINSSNETLSAARYLADSIGAKFYQWAIDEAVNSYTNTIQEALDRKLSWEEDDLALQNIQARARSPIIWMLTNISNTLLLTTSNRSEGDVGYTTMDGDTSGSLAPISSVDKHFIRQWLKYAETELGYYGLSQINSLAPTAELRPSDQRQTDEDDLMPYHIMVEIEHLAIGQHQSPQEVFNNLKMKGLEKDEILKGYIKKFYLLWSRNQWKRERLAPAFHLDRFNVDPRTWCRFPILSAGYVEELRDL